MFWYIYFSYSSVTHQLVVAVRPRGVTAALALLCLAFRYKGLMVSFIVTEEFIASDTRCSTGLAEK